MRASMLTEFLRSRWLTTAYCPKCGEENMPKTRPIAMNEDGRATCDTCGHVWTPEIR